MTRAVFIASMMVALGTPTHGQVRVVRSGDDRLAGIRAVDVLVTQTETTATCALTTSSIQALAIDTLRTAGIQATLSQKARSTFYSVVIDIGSARREAICAADVTTELVAQVNGIPEADRWLAPGEWGSLLVGFMPLLHHNTLVIGPALEHDASVRHTVRAQVAAVADKIRSINSIKPIGP